MSEKPPTPPEPSDGSAGPSPAQPMGSNATASAPGPISYVSPAPGVGDPADVEKNKVMALLSYISILWLVPLLAAKDSPFAKFHCNQGILLSICGFCTGMVMAIGGMIPFVNICIMCILGPILLITILTFAIIGILNALNGKMKPLPFFPVVTWVK
ncbi:MAG TPA: zinc ribbon domain-containing protein [Phycisphaerae bacterium]|jgi:uncharacterized membrane protein